MAFSRLAKPLFSHQTLNHLNRRFATRFAQARSASNQPISALSRPLFSEGSNSKAKLAMALAAVTVTTAIAAKSSSNGSIASADDLLGEINDRLIFLEGLLTNWKSFLSKLDQIKSQHPNNLMAKHFDVYYFQNLSPDLQKRLLKIVNSGLVNPDSSMGCYAMQPDDYDTFKPYLDKVIRDYHKIKGEVKHVTNWEVPKDFKNLDLTKLGLGTTSMRVRVGRNLESYPLPGAMTKQDRINMEKDMIKAFKKLIADKSYGGKYYSLTPGSEYEITDAFYQELVNSHIMFKDMANDTYLAAAGIASDWPYGRGCYVSEDKGFIVWVGEEDHLRIMCMKKGTVLNDVFDRLRGACDVVEQNASKFAHSKDYGYVTSCPTNLGTGMRASVHIKVPNLTKGGSEEKAKAVCRPLGLSVRGVGGEHTAIGADGTVDISPSARLCIEEGQIIVALYKGIELLLQEEKKASKL